MQRNYTSSEKSREARNGRRPDSRPNLARVAPISRRALGTGTVVWAHVPYESGDGEKSRPAIVLEVRGRDVVFAPATTSARAADYPHQYVEIHDPTSAGLDRRTWVKNRVVVLDLIEIVSVSGTLSELDLARVLRKVTVLAPGEAA